MNIRKTALSLALSAGLIITTSVSASAKTIVNCKVYGFNGSCIQLAERLESLCKPGIQFPGLGGNDTQAPDTSVPEQDTNTPEVEAPETENNQQPEISADEFELKVLELVNIERAKQGLSALTWDSSLAAVAEAHSLDMAQNNFFSHTNLKGQSPFDRMKAFGISYSYAAENIAAGQKTPESVMESWMNSEGHRKNILNKNVTKLGVGYVKGGSYGTYWTQNFAG